MKKSVKSLVFLMLIAVLALACVMSSAAVNLPEAVGAATKSTVNTPQITITGDRVGIRPGEILQLKAELTGTKKTYEISWESSDESVASVDQNGIVVGKKIGRTIITASATVKKQKIEGKYAVNVLAAENGVRTYLSQNQILSYMYSYVDDYYYTDDKNCWQDTLGFARIYDLIAPYFVLEYDYIRVFFPYDGKDFMVQLWKGQYGYIFYGGEIGVYHKKATGKVPGMLTFFKTADEEYWPYMEMSLYHQKLDGEYEREFTRDYDRYWWCTGFKNGHLRVVEPADELRIIARLTMNDSEMAGLFAQGLSDCGFKQAEVVDDMELDSFYHKGKDVYVVWQNISEAENTMPLKLTVAALAFFNVFAFLAAMLIIPVAIGPVTLLMIII